MIKTYVEGVYKVAPILMVWYSYDDNFKYVIAHNNQVGQPDQGFRNPEYSFKTQKEAKQFLSDNFKDSELWVEKPSGFVRFQERKK